ncbi:uncharacterized protein [Heterodontus francisci]|uniref:uncharacterized protein n=1 Tax=Heterodontus francisci TaxID=7792 RepID=UPI00355B6398
METPLNLQEENESNGEGQGRGAFEKWIHLKVTERQSVNSEKLNPSAEQEIKGWLPLPSRGPENWTQTTIDAKESGLQEKEKSQCISEIEVNSDNASKRDVQRILQTLQMASEATLTVTVPPVGGSPIVHQQKQSDGEDPPTRTSSGVNQVESRSPSQQNPSTTGTEETGEQGKSGGGSRESLLDLGDVPLLSAAGKDCREHLQVDSKILLAGGVGLAGGGSQAMAHTTGSEAGEEKDERRRPVLFHNVSDTTQCAGVDVAIGSMEQECPVCTEMYDSGTHKQALLNCNHSFCDSCVKSIMEKVGENSTSQICCPICRQRTPMPMWEIRQFQEEMTFLSRVVAGSPGAVPTHPTPRRGPCRQLEQAFRQRLQTTRSCGYLPCLRYPLWLVNVLARCDQTSSCCYLCSILLLYGLELLCLSLIFTPVIILILLFTLL